jgi:prepilin-type N-terminal cleavage/methylation domain-containing protein
MAGRDLNKGFTLLELLIVIAIIGLLASVVMVQFPGATKKARDARRLSDVAQILTALRIYHANTGTFPARTADACCDDWDQGPCNGDDTFIAGLITEGAATVVPVDPAGGSGTGCYGYNYYVYSAGSYGCDSSKGKFFVLGIRDLETSPRPYPESPGWSCANRNWQNEFDWVTGAYEKDFSF